jgi:adenylate cyclase
MTESQVILVVDDNEMNRDMLSRRLLRQGFTVEMAEHGQMALDMLRENSYALMLLDVMMPHMNGYEVLEAVKNDSDLNHLPIIMISAVDDLESVVKCIELGADDYLFKPFNPILLKARVTSSLRRSHKRQTDGWRNDVNRALTEMEDAMRSLEGDLTGHPKVAQLQAKLDALQKLIKS